MGQEVWYEDKEEEKVAKLYCLNMLVQWRYKVCKKFANNQGAITGGGEFRKREKVGLTIGKAFLYKPTKRGYDYVDYTGRVCKCDSELSEMTLFLEFMGYIKFIGRKNLE